MLKNFLVAACVGGIGGILGLASPAFAQDSSSSVVVTREVVVTQRVVPGAQRTTAAAYPGSDVANSAGGVGGAIGGYYINGTTRADNKPLPGGTWPYR